MTPAPPSHLISTRSSLYTPNVAHPYLFLVFGHRSTLQIIPPNELRHSNRAEDISVFFLHATFGWASVLTQISPFDTVWLTFLLLIHLFPCVYTHFLLPRTYYHFPKLFEQVWGQASIFFAFFTGNPILRNRPWYLYAGCGLLIHGLPPCTGRSSLLQLGLCLRKLFSQFPSFCDRRTWRWPRPLQAVRLLTAKIVNL